MPETDAPKLGEVRSVQRSSGVIVRPLVSFHMLCRRFWCVCITPLGRPVEPDVKSTYARSPGDGGVGGDAAAGGPSARASRPTRGTPPGASEPARSRLDGS